MSFFFGVFSVDGFLVVVLIRIYFFSVMSFVGCDYRKERKGVADDEDEDSPPENFDDENDNYTTTGSS